MTSGEALLILNSVPDCGPIRIARLLNRFQNPEDILTAPVKELTSVQGITAAIAHKIRSWHESFTLEDELKKIEEHQNSWPNFNHSRNTQENTGNGFSSTNKKVVVEQCDQKDYQYIYLPVSNCYTCWIEKKDSDEYQWQFNLRRLNTIIT